MKSICISITGANCHDNDLMRAEFFQVLEECRLHVRNSSEHIFYPNGFTLMAILAESHAVISTWPEDNRVEVDLFCCSAVDRTGEFLEAIKKRFHGFCKPFMIDREKMIQVTP